MTTSRTQQVRAPTTGNDDHALNGVKARAVAGWRAYRTMAVIEGCVRARVKTQRLIIHDVWV